MSMQMVLWKRGGASKMVVENRNTNHPSEERKPKMTMTRGGVLRSTRAGEGSRKAAIVKYALDHLVRHKQGRKDGGIQSYIIDSSLSMTESKMVLVGMTKTQFLEWAEMPNPGDIRGENRSYIQCGLSSLPHIQRPCNGSAHIVGHYYREPGLSMRPLSSILVAMTEDQLQDWCSMRAMQKVNDHTLARREAEEQAALFSRGGFRAGLGTIIRAASSGGFAPPTQVSFPQRQIPPISEFAWEFFFFSDSLFPYATELGELMWVGA
ncbi:hypothetical protein BDZ45DRAFT_721554 [Acephala macrosclerotiorum]|nr:hypothetical protein BDZ45DRAFT_721554 [Acephala macrosclerotiorum]